MNSADQAAALPVDLAGMTVRPSTAGDVPAIAAIYAHHVVHGLASFEIVPPDATEIARRRDEALARGLPYFVGLLGGAVAGFAYAAPYRPRPAYASTLEDSVYVDPSAGRRGLGRALLDLLLATCAALGYRQMIAVIGDSGNAASIRLHEACGFVRTGLLPSVGHKHGRWVDSVLMQRALGAGDSTAPSRGHEADRGVP